MHNPALHFEHLAECYNIVGINLTQKISRKREKEREDSSSRPTYTQANMPSAHTSSRVNLKTASQAVCGPLNIRARYIFFFFFFFFLRHFLNYFQNCIRKLNEKFDERAGDERC
jgi:hypothetical protein